MSIKVISVSRDHSAAQIVHQWKGSDGKTRSETFHAKRQGSGNVYVYGRKSITGSFKKQGQVTI